MIRRDQIIPSADTEDAKHYDETETLLRLKVIYQTNLAWLGVEIRRLKIKRNKLPSLSTEWKKIRRVIKNARRLEKWADSLKQAESVTEIAYCAYVLEAAACAMDNPIDQHTCLLRFSVSTFCVEPERQSEAPNLLRTCSKSFKQ